MTPQDYVAPAFEKREAIEQVTEGGNIFVPVSEGVPG